MLNFLLSDGSGYFARVAGKSRSPERVREISEAIERRGFYEHRDEWRISTVTKTRVTPAEELGVPGFEVTVECDVRFRSWSPTIERAAEFVGIYEQIIPGLFSVVGWPSWAGKDRARP